MKKTLTKILALVMALAMVFALCACGERLPHLQRPRHPLQNRRPKHPKKKLPLRKKLLFLTAIP